MKKNISLFIFILVLVPALVGFAGQDRAEQAVSGETVAEGLPAAESGENLEKNTLEMLHSIVKLKNDLKQRMIEKKQMIKKADSETEKGILTTELENIDKQLAGAVMDFERIATGVDITLFAKKKAESFNWKNELLSLAEPGIMEIKRLTVKARHKTKLKDELSAYQDLMPVAVRARTRIEALIAETKDPVLKKSLDDLLPEYKGVESQIANKLDLVRLQLEEIERGEESLIDSTQDSVKNFFRTRGCFFSLPSLYALVLFFF